MFGAVFLVTSLAAAQAPSPAAAAFLMQIQQVLRANDRQAMAALIHYPVTATISGVRVLIGDPAAMVDRYDSVFTVTMRETIAMASVPEPDVRNTTAGLPGRWVIGADAVQFGPVNGQFRMTAFVVPAARTVTDAVVPSHQQTAGFPGRSEPRRLGVRAGPGPTRVAGSLYADSTDTYVIHVPKGQLLSVRLERVRAGEAVLRVVHVGSGEPLNPSAADEGRFVAGRALDSADYRIDVRRNGGDAAPLPYMLAIGLR
jgi:hypothetical protein